MLFRSPSPTTLLTPCSSPALIVIVQTLILYIISNIAFMYVHKVSRFCVDHEPNRPIDHMASLKRRSPSQQYLNLGRRWGGRGPLGSWFPAKRRVRPDSSSPRGRWASRLKERSLRGERVVYREKRVGVLGQLKTEIIVILMSYI